MIDHKAIRAALRTRLKSLVVCTTGEISLSAGATGFSRTDGSFIDDGFAQGMELLAAGFATESNNGVAVISAVTDLNIQVSSKALTTDIAAAGCTLSVGLPIGRDWENVNFTPVTNAPWVEEQYVRGPAGLTSIGSGARLVGEPMYLPRIHVQSNIGTDALDKYVDAIVNLFPPSDVIELANGDTIHIRADTAPYGGQVQQSTKGSFAGILCTIPCRCYSINAI